MSTSTLRLYEACKERDWDNVLKIINQLDVDLDTHEGYPLRQAVANGVFNVAKALTLKGADVHARNNEALWLAVKNNDEKLIELLLSVGADPNTVVDVEKLGAQPLLVYAMHKCNWGAAQFLIDSGADLDVSNGFPLRQASHNGKEDLVRSILKSGANVHAMNEGALVEALNAGHLEMAKILLSFGANPKAVNKEGHPLIWAMAKAFQWEMVSSLVDAGADIHINNDYVLRQCVANNQLDLVQKLLKKGADVHAVNDEALWKSALENNEEMVKLLLEFGANPNEFLESRGSIFVDVLRNFKWEPAMHMIKAGADINASYGFALRQATHNNKIDVVKHLIKDGALLDLVGSDKMTAIMIAAKNFNWDIVNILVKAGANIHIMDDYVLRQAAHNGKYELVRVLLESGADVTALDNQAIRYAYNSGHFETVDVLLEFGADPNVIDSSSESLLLKAFKTANWSMVNKLIDQGADIHFDQDFPLRFAVCHGKIDLVTKLIKEGADIHVNKEEVLWSAVRGSHYAIVDLLIKSGSDLKIANLKYPIATEIEVLQAVMLDESGEKSLDYQKSREVQPEETLVTYALNKNDWFMVLLLLGNSIDFSLPEENKLQWITHTLSSNNLSWVRYSLNKLHLDVNELLSFHTSEISAKVENWLLWYQKTERDWEEESPWQTDAHPELNGILKSLQFFDAEGLKAQVQLVIDQKNQKIAKSDEKSGSRTGPRVNLLIEIIKFLQSPEIQVNTSKHYDWMLKELSEVLGAKALQDALLKSVEESGWPLHPCIEKGVLHHIQWDAIQGNEPAPLLKWVERFGEQPEFIQWMKHYSSTSWTTGLSKNKDQDKESLNIGFKETQRLLSWSLDHGIDQELACRFFKNHPVLKKELRDIFVNAPTFNNLRSTNFWLAQDGFEDSLIEDQIVRWAMLYKEEDVMGRITNLSLINFAVEHPGSRLARWIEREVRQGGAEMLLKDEVLDMWCHQWNHKDRLVPSEDKTSERLNTVLSWLPPKDQRQILDFWALGSYRMGMDLGDDFIVEHFKQWSPEVQVLLAAQLLMTSLTEVHVEGVDARQKVWEFLLNDPHILQDLGSESFKELAESYRDHPGVMALVNGMLYFHLDGEGSTQVTSVFRHFPLMLWEGLIKIWPITENKEPLLQWVEWWVTNFSPLATQAVNQKYPMDCFSGNLKESHKDLIELLKGAGVKETWGMKDRLKYTFAKKTEVLATTNNDGQSAISQRSFLSTKISQELWNGLLPGDWAVWGRSMLEKVQDFESAVYNLKTVAHVYSRTQLELKMSDQVEGMLKLINVVRQALTQEDRDDFKHQREVMEHSVNTLLQGALDRGLKVEPEQAIQLKLIQKTNSSPVL